jgi:hypothetical protein
MINRPAATFEGIQIYLDPDELFKFRYALNWDVWEMPEHPGGRLVSPPHTAGAVWLAAWKQDLGSAILPEDVDTLRAGLEEGLRQLGENVLVSRAQDEWIGNLLRFERVFSFERGGESFQRRQWVVFADHYQIVLIYHAPASDYEHWLAMANYTFFTFEIPEFVYFNAEQRTRQLEAAAETL